MTSKMLYSENSFVVDEDLALDGLLCEICCDLMEGTVNKGDYDMSCKHNFCTRCWKNYLHTKIQDGKTDTISCPAFDCNIMVPVAVIERFVSPQMARKYLKFDLDCFVETNKSIKWCPYPACQRAVNLPESERQLWEDRTLVPPVSHAVDCGGGHFFCWDCGSPEAHAPLSCNLWQKWLARCAEVVPASGTHTSGCYEEAANFLWLVTNSKPCPNCRSPIQKTDGCNHIKCSKCRYDFCWVCLESWKKHSAATGGYFQCNRYPNLSTVPESDLSNSGHQKSMHRSMEEPLLRSAKKKREIMRSSLTNDVMDRRWSTLDRRTTTSLSTTTTMMSLSSADTFERNTKFYEDGVWELLKARTCLCGSYAYGFFIEEETSMEETMVQRRRVFEMMQNELEEVTETLSEMIARPYLRTPRKVIVQTVQLCRRKRQEFLRSAYKGFVPQDVPVAQTNQLNLSKSLNSSLVSSSCSGINSLASGQMAVDRKRLVESMTEDVYGRKSEMSLTKATAGLIRLRQCCRTGCPNLCLSTSGPNSRLREFCSPTCSMKSGRRNTVEKFEPLPQIVEGAGALSTGVGSFAAGRYHTLPHNASLSSAVVEEEERQLSLAVELSLMDSKENFPPKVPPHKQLTTSSKSNPIAPSSSSIIGSCNNTGNNSNTGNNTATQSSLTSAQKQARFSSKSISTDGAEGRCLNEPKPRPEPVANLASANETVASFLRSIAFKEEDETSQSSSFETPLTTVTYEVPQASSLVRRTGEVADGKFRIGDIHESGRYNNADDKAVKNAAALALLKRSQSTGDIDDVDDKSNDAPFIDSDHSCCQEQPPEFRKIDRSRKFEVANYEEEGSDTTSAEKTDATRNDATTLIMFSTSLRGQKSGKEQLVSSKSENFLSAVATKKASKSVDARRPKFIRQKSFEIDSDSTDIDNSLTPSTEPAPKPELMEAGKNPMASLNAPGSVGSSTPSTCASNRKRPDLTIKIYNSSFDTVAGDSDPISDAFRNEICKNLFCRHY